MDVEIELEFDQWMAAGIKAGWCGPPVCAPHDGIPMTMLEEEGYDDGDDPCIHILRMYPDHDVKWQVEANHSPSNWRDIYTSGISSDTSIDPA